MALLIAALSAATLLAQGPARAPGDSIVLRVFATNDIHGHLESRPEAWSNRRPVGGAAALAGMMDRLAAQCGCTTIRLDAGDLMQGTPISNLTYGRSSVDAANAMGYAAMAVGNHEFDWSVDTLIARIHQSHFTWISSNIVDLHTHRHVAWAVPWRIVTAGRLRIALVGYTTPGTTTSTNPLNVEFLGFGGAPMLDSAIAAARAQRPDFVIVVAHEGAFCDRDNGPCHGEIVTLAQDLVHKPDLIVSGHTHSLVNTVVNGIPIVQARSYSTALGVVDFVATDTGRVARISVQTVWADRETPDTAVARVVAGYERGVDSIANRRVVVLADPLDKDSTLADMVAEALRRAAGAQVGLVNITGVRRDLQAGPTTWGDLFEVLPFGNYVVRLDVTGLELRAAVEHGLAGGEPRARYAGLIVDRDPSAPGRALSLRLADGSAVDDAAHYTLGTEDFLANGGSGYAMLRGVPTTNTGVVDLDAFIRYLTSLPQPVHAPAAAERTP